LLSLLLLAVCLIAGLLLVLLVWVGGAWGGPICSGRVSCMLRRVCGAIGRCIVARRLLLVLRVMWRRLCLLLAIGWVGSRGSFPGRGRGRGWCIVARLLLRGGLLPVLLSILLAVLLIRLLLLGWRRV
jgi:hypothetical protein